MSKIIRNIKYTFDKKERKVLFMARGFKHFDHVAKKQH